ncbi:NgoPII family restriction endonuclease, partial [Mycobacterium tuberculosis]|nr:NgoPII family restriction endonuclease [Mycobacterium tuberculosis]
NQSLNALCFVYGVNYFANEKLYTIPTQSDFTDINEVVTVDLTAKWRIKNPFHVFDYIYQPKYSSDFNFMAIINDKKS